ncbi:hypothetical protein INT43_002080 [Umbelopsis isabellina]|uniref:SET domain-containing protein n=1 Tax=Mortierella isabellina TaxID=91625 RepID=A0A8H7PSS5_MORIS|nr:hypothetical protein INT43_002080 [Umbelopsis isabellina]
MHTVQWQALQAHLRAHHLELADDPKKYRKVLALNAMKRGSVAIESHALAFVPLPSVRAEICNYCFKRATRATPLQRCSRCQSAYYCSKHCFQKAWFAAHQYVCKANQPSATQEDQDKMDELMLERVILSIARAKNDITHNAADLALGAHLEAFSSLLAHETKQPQDQLDRFKHIATAVIQKPHIKSLGIDAAALLIYLCRFRSNNFGIIDNQLFPIGEGTYPIGSLFNHSCRPNAVALYNGTSQIIRLIDDVEEGEEITLAYIDVANSRKTRQQMLRDKYFFECECTRCSSDHGFGLVDQLLGEPSEEEDVYVEGGETFLKKTLMEQVESWNVLELTKRYPPGSDATVSPGFIMDIPRYVHFMGTFMFPSVANRSLRADGLLEAPKEVYEQLLFNAAAAATSYPLLDETEHGGGVLKPYSLKTLTVATRLLNEQMAKNRWPQSSRLAMLVLTHYMFIYPRNHPMLALHFLTVAKAAWNALVQLEVAGINRKLEKEYERGVSRWIHLAKSTLSCNFGEQGEHWREIVELEWIFNRDQKLK